MTPPTRRPGPNGALAARNRLEKWLGVIPFALLFFVWWLVTRLGLVGEAALPSPAAVYAALAQLTRLGDLQQDVLISLLRLGLGVGVSIVVGVGLGLVAGMYRGIGDFLLPLASFFNSVSGIAWIPLAITWFGLGTATVTFIIVNSVIFLVFFNTVLGVRSVPKSLEQAVQTLGGGRREVIFQVLLPGALPHILLGVRSGIGFGWRGLIAAELIAATTGLGFMIFNASNFFRTDQIVGGVIIIGSLWMALDGLVLGPLERRTVERWGMVRSP